MRRSVIWTAAAALVLLPLSLAGVDIVFYQCVDGEGAVRFTNRAPRGEQRCIRLGAREERSELDDKVRRCFIEGAGSMPALTGNVIQNSRASLQRFHDKLQALAAGRERSVAIYFVGDSHLQSGDLVKGFLDELELDHQVDRTLLCVHKVVNNRARKGRNKRPARLPKDYPNGVPRICLPLVENAAPALPDQDSDRSFGFASSTPVGNPSDNAARQKGPVNVYAYGISGKTFEYFAGSELLEKDLVSYRPDLIVVMLGTNDAFARPEPETVKRDVAAFAGSIRRASPESEVLFISPPDSFFKNGRDNEYINLVRKELQTIAVERGFAFWDLYTVMGGPRSMVKWQEKGLSQKDRVHFLADGYMILGRLFYQALVQ